MTKKQKQQVADMYAALRSITKDYYTPDQMRSGKGLFGIDYAEGLAMAYENIQATAAKAIKGVSINRILKTEK